MASNRSFVPKIISDYLIQINGPRRTVVEIALDETTEQMPDTFDGIISGQRVNVMKISTSLANFLALQTKLLGRQHNRPMKTLDIGTFTGRSALAVAQAMPNGGKVIACDLSKKYTAIAKEHWEKAGINERIELRLAPAKETLQQLLDNGEANSFDLAFIDADKANYDLYYEKCLQLLRPGGLIILDNMLWSGRVADVSENDLDTAALRALNLKISADKRVEPVLLSFEDGVMVVEKRGETLL